MLEDARDCFGLGDFANHTKLPPTVGTHTQLGIALQVLSKQPHCFSKRTNLAVWVLPSGRVGN